MEHKLRTVSTVGVSCASVVMLAACSMDAPSSELSPSFTNTPTLLPASSPNATDSGTPHDEGSRSSPVDVAEAVDLGAEALAAFCRPALDYETWIGELYPFLSQAAGAAYETVDPANVPCTSVTGEPVVRDGDDPYTVGLGVPTDVGEYAVYLHRTGTDAPWAVEQITPVSAD